MGKFGRRPWEQALKWFVCLYIYVYIYIYRYIKKQFYSLLLNIDHFSNCIIINGGDRGVTSTFPEWLNIGMHDSYGVFYFNSLHDDITSNFSSNYLLGKYLLVNNIKFQNLKNLAWKKFYFLLRTFLSISYFSLTSTHSISNLCKFHH